MRDPAYSSFGFYVVHGRPGGESGWVTRSLRHRSTPDNHAPILSDNLDQSPEFDPADPEPIPDHTSRGARDFDQTQSPELGRLAWPAPDPAAGAPGFPKNPTAVPKTPPHWVFLTPPSAPSPLFQESSRSPWTP